MTSRVAQPFASARARAKNSVRTALSAMVMIALASCATYHPLPLATEPTLATKSTELATIVPDGPDHPAFEIDVKRPLRIDEIGILAILNDPELKSEAGKIAVAQAGLVQATILPNPVGNINYAAPISGLGAAATFSSGISQEVAAIITRGARVRSAQAQVYAVDADLLWREWQVAQKARQYALDIYAANLSIELTERERRLLADELAKVNEAITAGGMSLDSVAPIAKAMAGVDQSLVSLRLDRLKTWQALNALLGLQPNARFSIVRPQFGALPPNLEMLIAQLPDRRPDLGALRLGYQSAEEDVRAAILGQFPALGVGGSYGTETPSIVTAGPTFNFALPVFDRNQGPIAKTAATRLQLQAEYQARLDNAVATAHALVAQIHQLSADLVHARRANSKARELAETARQAFARSSLDQRTLTDYETTALDRALQVVNIERQINEDKIFLAVELGLGLPNMRIALSGGFCATPLCPRAAAPANAAPSQY